MFIEGVQVLDVKLADKTRFSLGRSELRFEPETRHEIQWPLSPHDRFGEVLGKSTSMRRAFAVLERAAPTESGVVLEGEPGTGKEALARAIHDKSRRREQPFVVVDVASTAEALIEPDLFGHEVSSSRPMARPGAFEEADGGTVYIEDVSELPLTVQARLLRTIETREIKRPGSPQLVKLDVRVVASTNKDLEAQVKAGRFREDLFFKLSVFRVRVPPLRERSEDVALLVRHFEQKNRSPALAEDTLEMLSRHDWPGNVRELLNVLERLQAFPDLGAGAMAKAMGKSSDDDESSGARLRKEMSKQLLSLPYHEAKERVLESFEKTYLLEHLRAANGVVTRAAQRAGLPRQSVHRMLRRLGISTADE